MRQYNRYNFVLCRIAAGLRAYGPMTESERLAQFPLVDVTGQRYFDNCSRISSSQNMGARPNLCYEWRRVTNLQPSKRRLSKECLLKEFAKCNGNCVIKENGNLQHRKYECDYSGKQAGNSWMDILVPLGIVCTVYPIQKPSALLCRIVKHPAATLTLYLFHFVDANRLVWQRYPSL